MVNYCCVFGCKNSSKSHPHLAYFTFPSEHERITSWLKAIDREDINNKNKAAFRVCQMHFEPNSLHSVSKLDKNAMPSLHLPNTSNITLAGLKQEPPEETEDSLEDPGTSATADCLEKQMDTKENVLLVAEKIAKLTRTPNEIISIEPESRQTWNCTTQTDFHKYKGTKGCQTPLRLIGRKKPPKHRQEQANNEMNKIYFGTRIKSIRLQNFHDLCDKYLNGKLAHLVKMQSLLKKKGHKLKGNRYSEEYKLFCAKLHQSSPHLYPAFQDWLCLPSAKTLRRSKTAPTDASESEEQCQENDSTKPGNTDFDMVDLDTNQDNNIATSGKSGVPPYPGFQQVMLSSARMLKRSKSASTSTDISESDEQSEPEDDDSDEQSEPEENDLNEQSEPEENNSNNQESKTEPFEHITHYDMVYAPETNQDNITSTLIKTEIDLNENPLS